MSDGTGDPPIGGGPDHALAGSSATPRRKRRKPPEPADQPATIEGVQTRWEWIVTLRPLKNGRENRAWVGIDPFIRMRGLLKRALRDYGFRCQQLKIRRKEIARRKARRNAKVAA